MIQDIKTDRYFYGIFGNTCVIRGVGKLTYRTCSSMNSFITKIFSDNIIENYIIDLTGAEYLDSTNLGMLARIQSLSRKKSGKIPVLVSSEATVNSILQIHGFDNLFTITATANLPGQATTEVLPEKQDGLGVESVLLAAHQELAATSEKNAAVYNNVIKLMKKDT